jgi:CSLREA domain-containing protein
MKRVTLAAVFCLVSIMASGETLTVTKTSDDPVNGCDSDCSLREAVIAANATVEHDTILVPAGTYVLSLVGADEDAAATGDLDLIEDVSIVGNPTGGTVIDGNLSDRLVHLNGATVELADLVLIRGSTTGDWYGAGGILVESGALTMTRSVLSDCSCDAHGGGIFSLGTVNIDQSAIVGNTGFRGGGIYHAGIDLTIVNSTVTGNTATDQGSGGISTDGLALAASIESSTITNNVGVHSDAVSFLSEVSVTNTIFDGSCAISPGMGVVNSAGGNLESPANTCGLAHPSDLVGATAGELNLGPLQGNGGLTPTHALHVGSVAIDSGTDPLCPATDQRDWLRWDGSCDIGAFEVNAIGSLLFANGFESGGTGAWSATIPMLRFAINQ